MIKHNYIFNGIAALFLLCATVVFVQFLAYHEVKCDESGIVLDDPVLNALPLGNYSLAIFSITYGVILYTIYISFRRPKLAGKFMMAYGLMLLIRMITLTIVPLKAPGDLIYLQDPFLNNLIYPGEVKNDLFVSGHTALVFIVFFLTKQKILLVIAALLGLLLMAQRVHYTIDVIGAIPISLLVVWISNTLTAKLTKAIE